MNWTPTPPTEPGWYYWRENAASGYYIVWESKMSITLKSKGEWGGRVPEPGATFTVEEFKEWLHWVDATDSLISLLTDPQDGIAATTARHRRKNK